MTGSVKLLTPSGGSVTINATDTASALSLTLPATNDNIITANTTQTLTNKTLTSPTISSPQITTGATINHTGSVDTGALLIGDTTTPASNTSLYLRSTTKCSINFSAGGVLAFNGAGDGSSERMRIDVSGNLLVGGAYLDPIGSRVNSFTWRPAGITVRQSGTNQFGISSTSGTQITWYTDNGTNYVGAGTITSSGSSTAYNTSSDQRLKENIVDAPNALDSINAIKVRSFDWKSDGSHSEYGYIAQELLEVAAEAVHIPDDPEEMMGVDFGKLTPRLVKAIQELSAQNNALEDRLAKLEAK